MSAQYPDEVVVHYYLPAGVHSADAYRIATAEIEFISLIREMASNLGVSIRLETEARTEGGIKQIWKAFGNNSGQIGCVLALISLMMELRPQADKELIRLHTEESRLHIDYLKQQLAKDAPPIDSNSITNAAHDLNNNLRVVRRRSNFYEAVHGDSRIEAVSLSLYDHGQLLPQVVHIKRDSFPEFIALKGSLPIEIDEDANIDIISPVLKNGRFKWKGIYNSQVIDFRVRDKIFRKSVLQKEVNFQNGTTINCILHIKIKVDEVGVISPAGYNVFLVKQIINGESTTTTEHSKKYFTLLQNEKDQLKLF